MDSMMSSLPRLAVGSVQSDINYRPILWALLDVLQRSGVQVQSFMSQSRFAAHDGAHSVTGLCSRYLDSWLMSAEQCKQIFYVGARQCNFSVVDGTFDTSNGQLAGGRLIDLCEWLDLPRIGVVHAGNLANCLLPTDRPAVDALFVDGVEGLEERYRWQTSLEALWGLPVIGALDTLPAVRGLISRLPNGCSPSSEICGVLGTSLMRHLDLQRLTDLANDRENPSHTKLPLPPDRTEHNLRVAVAFDKVFHHHFTDMLDMLEMSGLTIVDFSPLRDESLPSGTDIVYLGCGNPEFYADSLAANHCMHMSLRRHVRRGGPVYAEAAGIAFLCQYLRLPNGHTLPMAGVLPVDVQLQSTNKLPHPIELKLDKSCWLGRRHQVLRGYLDSTCTIEDSHQLAQLTKRSSHPFNLLGHRNVICSRLQLDFATQPKLLEAFYLRQPDLLETSVL